MLEWPVNRETDADRRRDLNGNVDDGLDLFAKLAAEVAAFQRNPSLRLGATEASPLNALPGNLAVDGN